MYKILILVLFVSCNAVAEDIFKCISKKGAVSFQNSPCPSNNKSKVVHSYTPLPPRTQAQIKEDEDNGLMRAALAGNRGAASMLAARKGWRQIPNQPQVDSNELVRQMDSIKNSMANDQAAASYEMQRQLDIQAAEFKSEMERQQSRARDDMIRENTQREIQQQMMRQQMEQSMREQMRR